MHVAAKPWTSGSWPDAYPLKDAQKKVLQSCNSMSDIREAAKKHPHDAVEQSLQQPTELLQEVFLRLSLKEKKVMLGTSDNRRS